jgi:2-haloacid dehalogenase
VTISAVFFDAYGTLFDVSGVAEVCASIVPRPETFVTGWRRRQLEYSWLRTLMNRYADFERVSADALDATAAFEGVVLDDRARSTLLEAWMRPSAFPDVATSLAALANHPRIGRRLGILSNGSPPMLATVLRHTGLADRFTWVLSVDEVHAYKPSPAVYALAVRASGASPEQILFVSSNGWDVAGATAFGFRACWVHRGNAAPEHLGETPRHVVPSLDDILGLTD